mmetsp:Transcript_37590/g.66760  ORF Transcript_37590/g.66760 Transcript_37590/m.66760 type:complete len:338 (-) Transcript_37590:362-1375(-)
MFTKFVPMFSLGLICIILWYGLSVIRYALGSMIALFLGQLLTDCLSKIVELIIFVMTCRHPCVIDAWLSLGQSFMLLSLLVAVIFVRDATSFSGTLTISSYQSAFSVLFSACGCSQLLHNEIWSRRLQFFRRMFKRGGLSVAIATSLSSKTCKILESQRSFERFLSQGIGRPLGLCHLPWLEEADAARLSVLAHSSKLPQPILIGNVAPFLIEQLDCIMATAEEPFDRTAHYAVATGKVLVIDRAVTNSPGGRVEINPLVATSTVTIGPGEKLVIAVSPMCASSIERSRLPMVIHKGFYVNGGSLEYRSVHSLEDGKLGATKGGVCTMSPSRPKIIH